MQSLRALSAQSFLIFTVFAHSFVKIAFSEEGFCSAPPISESQPLYWKVANPTLSPSHLRDLPGFTRSVYKRDHALITPESQVFSPLPGWANTSGAYLISPSMGSHFVMYLAKMEVNSKLQHPDRRTERFLFVLRGMATLTDNDYPRKTHKLEVDSYAYLPPWIDNKISVTSNSSALLVVFERRYESNYKDSSFPKLIIGSTDKQSLLETPGEVFELRKLLPTSLGYDFNIHTNHLVEYYITKRVFIDNGFPASEFLNVKEVHYNQHGLLLLEGQGIYRLGDNWYPVQAGDAIWMAPFVPQWYAALGKTKTRYLLYKDINRDPFLSLYSIKHTP